MLTNVYSSTTDPVLTNKQYVEDYLCIECINHTAGEKGLCDRIKSPDELEPETCPHFARSSRLGGYLGRLDEDDEENTECE